MAWLSSSTIFDTLIHVCETSEANTIGVARSYQVGGHALAINGNGLAVASIVNVFHPITARCKTRWRTEIRDVVLFPVIEIDLASDAEETRITGHGSVSRRDIIDAQLRGGQTYIAFKQSTEDPRVEASGVEADSSFALLGESYTCILSSCVQLPGGHMLNRACAQMLVAANMAETNLVPLILPEVLRIIDVGHSTQCERQCERTSINRADLNY